ncbi:MAG: ABC transporter ATP-binding protein, partial [Rhizobiaceae bacterium]|nr:ABC transporter ATP-binding protein [Rhizobiaceae bacterium]
MPTENEGLSEGSGIAPKSSGKADTRTTPLLDMRGIQVVFGNFVANDAVDLTVRAGEIHALLGENGAGKSTLMRVLAGLLVPSKGEVWIDGRREQLAGAAEAIRLGIGMVHQHFMLVPPLTVAENVCLGLPSTGRFIPNLKQCADKIRTLAKAYDLDVDPNARIADLSIASQQRVEILKVLYRGARILILDEPTAVLTPQETSGLFRVLRLLADQGVAIIFISHKLNEVMALTSHVTVLRHGRVVANAATTDTDARSLARVMVGADIALPKLEDTTASEGGAEIHRTTDVLSVDDLVCRDASGVQRVSGANLTLRSGEILGIAGVDGNGQQELAEAIVGLRKVDSGSITINGQRVTHNPVADRIRLGLAHIPEDRHRTALVEPMSITENAVLERIGDAPFSRRGWIDKAAVGSLADTIIRDFDVRTTGRDQKIGTLSGGNQQKVVLGRALSRDPSLIVAVQPVRGLDIGATAFVHRQLLARRAAGAGVLLISTELDEILA